MKANTQGLHNNRFITFSSEALFGIIYFVDFTHAPVLEVLEIKALYFRDRQQLRRQDLYKLHALIFVSDKLSGSLSVWD